MVETKSRDSLTSEDLFSQKIYWLNKLSGELPETNFLTDYVRPVRYSGKNQVVTFDLPDELSEIIFKLTQNSHFSIYLFLLSALSILVQKYTGSKDVIVGSPIYSKESSEGLINKVVPLRFSVTNQLTFKDFLLQVKDTTISAYSHGNYPFDELVRLLKLPQSQNRCPIFDIVALLENIHDRNALAVLQNDLTVAFRVDENKICGEIEYNDSIFKNETIKLIARQYINTIRRVIEKIYLKISDIVLLEQSELNQLLEKFNDNTKTYPVNQTLHNLFEDQVEKTPKTIAGVFRNKQLTYQELNDKANQLARLLQNSGVSKGEFVCILKERDTNFLIAILAILKAGGVYVPIDSIYPPERIRYMLSNSEVRFLLTDASFLNVLTNLLEPCSHLRCITYLDGKPNNIAIATPAGINIYDQQDFDKLPKENLGESHEGIAPAYMIYTSGSTGLPKGAIIRHGSAINHIYAELDALELTEDFNFLQTAPASSDISVWQFLAPILIGGKTVIIDTETVCNPEKLFRVIKEEKITIVELVPVVLRGLLDYISHLSTQQRFLPDLKWMMVTGESVSVELVNQWLQMYPSIKVVNAYGPTEAADDITQFIVEKPLPENQRTLPIGKSLANLNLYILDGEMQLVPIGVPGEICVSGFGVAQGYWKNEEKTNLSFVPNPFPTTAKPLPGIDRDLIYKTGDLGRWLPDGNIEFLGRIDHQVKIRGFRIELGEIEALLSQHPAVRETVVVAREDSPGDKRLVAYVVAIARRALSCIAPELMPNGDSDDQFNTQDSAMSSELVSQLRNFLKERLPEYMVPSAFVLLEALPIAPSGKVDRKALPAPDLSQLQPQGTFVTASTPVEEVLAGIWAEVLSLEKVGVRDNFFELGGHSLLATRVISQVRQVFKLEIPLRRLFESPTVAELAKDIETASKTGLGLEAPPIDRISREGDLPLSFAQQRLWFLSQLEPDNPLYNSPAAIRLKGQLNIAALEQSLNEILRRHEVLRICFKTVEGRPVQVISPVTPLSLPVIDLSELPQATQETKVRQLAIAHAQQPFALDTAPMLRVKLLRLSQQEHVALFVMHHIVCDGWSTDVLVRELSTLYKAFSTGQPSPLPELPIQYVDFAVWQRKWLQGEVLEKQLAYWKQQLGGNLPVLQLPTVRPRESVKTSRGATQSFVIPSNLSAALQALSRQEGVTLFMTLLAAFQILLQRYTNEDDIVVGTDVANRNRAEIESLIGFFVNLLVLRTDLSGNPSFWELLKRVREVTLGAYAHQDLPFDKLVEVLRPDRQSSHTPLFQVLFVLQNAPMTTLELPGLTLNQLEIEEKITRFDLALFVIETAQGIEGMWQYNADLFDSTTIQRMSDHFETLLSSIVAQPDARINSLEMLTDAEKEQQAVKKRQQKASKLKKFMAVQPKAVDLSQDKLIETGSLQPGQTLPLTITPKVDDVDIVDWAKSNHEFIETKLLHHGAILFRNFGIANTTHFESLASSICPGLFGEYGDLPREGVSGKVYGSTPYPSEQAILFHNESSHMHCWPQKIWFFCVQPAQQGGETPIVDCRKVLQMLAPKVREKFASKQLMYVRNYTDGLDVSWQDFFHTTDKTEVEEYCRKASITVEWKPDGGLRTHQVRPAIIKHPKTGEPVFFNQIQLHHASYLQSDVRESLMSLFGEENLPRHVYYGDGSPIEESVIEEILAIYQEATVNFPWQQGDVLMLDNMLTAHGRNPYVGSRKIVVAMGEMVHSADTQRNV
jgi:amino acid adenylation domain-containing protein